MVKRIAVVLLLVVAAHAPRPALPRAESHLPSRSTSAVPSPVAAARGWLAYQSLTPRGGDGVFLVRADGSDDHEILADLPGEHFHPDFSRDGKRLAFDQLTSMTSPDQIYVADANGSRPRHRPVPAAQMRQPLGACLVPRR